MEGTMSWSSDNFTLAMKTFQPPLIQTEPLVFFPYVSLTILAMVVGVIGNVCLVVTLLKNRGLQKVGREFMLNMSFADLCVTGLADPLCIVASIKGEEYLVERPILCWMIASVCLSACFCAFLSLSCITMSRMVFICHNNMYNKLFSSKKALFQCFLCWLIGMGMEVGNFLGWGNHYYDRKNESCIWDRTASFSYTYFVGLVLITGPLLMMMMSNIKIFNSIRDTKSNLAKVKDTDDHPVSVWRETIKACQTLFVMFIAFVICWVPYTVVILIDVRNDIVSPRVHLYVTWLAHLHSAVIVCVYMTNRQIRHAVLRTFGCGNLIEESSSSGATGATSNGANSINGGTTNFKSAVSDSGIENKI